MCICISIAQAAEEPPSIMPAESHEEAMSQVAVTVRPKRQKKRRPRKETRNAANAELKKSRAKTRRRAGTAVTLDVRAFGLRTLAQNGCPGPGAQHFPRKFSHQLAIVTCSCAFRLRRLAQNEKSRTEILPRGPFIGSLFRYLAKRPLAEILPKELL